ncbi:MAG: AAA family ATPase [Methanoregulaceae archaeon]|nr:AAA family ATPase [Methanoregulaceae archaeon]
MRVTVSGLPGSGTTSLARHIAKTHQFHLISAGEVFRRMAEERSMDIGEFGNLAEKDPCFDRMIDEKQREISRMYEDIVIEGRLSAWFVPDADLKIWLFAPLETRIMRIQVRDAFSDIGTATRQTQEREASEAARYRSYYNIDIHDISPYQLVLNSGLWEVEELGMIVDRAIDLKAKRTT